MKRIFAALLLTAALWSSAAAADARIAVVDLNRVFREYYKSKIAEGVIKQQSEVYRAYLLKLNDQLRKLESDFNVARDTAQNLALAPEARQKAEAEAQQIRRDLTARRAEAEAYAADKNSRMRELEQSKRREILSDIQTQIKRRALAAGYDFVLDSSGRTMNDLPAVLCFPEAADLTAEVIKVLNAAGKVPAAPAPEAAAGAAN